jgi:hypothetical protein
MQTRDSQTGEITNKCCELTDPGTLTHKLWLMSVDFWIGNPHTIENHMLLWRNLVSAQNTVGIASDTFSTK